MDLSNPNKTPFGEMTDAEKGALLLAHRSGEVEYLGEASGVWQSKTRHIALNDSSIYRVSPEPKCETVTMHGRINSAWYWIFYDSDKDARSTHRITFTTIDGKPDCSSVKMEAV